MNQITQQYEMNIKQSEQEEFNQYLRPYLMAHHESATKLESEVISKVFYVYLELGILNGKALTNESKFAALVSRRCRAHLRAESVKKAYISSVKPSEEVSINVPKLAYRVVEELEELILNEGRHRDSTMVGRMPDLELGYLGN
jgi:predicted RNA-binding protein (virulence factor B family)